MKTSNPSNLLVISNIDQEKLNPIKKNQNKTFDIIILILLLIATSVIIWINNLNSYQPAEDASMLLRYAENLANGHGIVWNVGGNPVDGATDFLFMATVAALSKIGPSIDLSAKILTIISHLYLVGLIFLSARKLYKSQLIFSLLLSLYLALGPGVYYINTSFGTSFFAFWGTLTWLFANLIIKRETTSTKLAIAFNLSALITGLIRPEGVFLTIFMLGAICYYKGLKSSLTEIISFAAIFGILGGIYFFWHWLYFGYPLPNPFYVKGGGAIRVDSLISSVTNVLNLVIPFVFVLFLGLREQKSIKRLVFLLIPVFGFTLIWVLLSNAMNWGGRFQYIVLPIFLITLPSFLPSQKKEIDITGFRVELGKKISQVSLKVLICAGILIYQIIQVTNMTNPPDFNFVIAINLSKFNSQAYTIATSEAGLLPYYSKWKAIDTYGLNDKWIAHNGVITDDYLDRYKPEIIMFHAQFSPLINYKFEPDQFNTRNWGLMVAVLKRYAEKNNYVLAAVYGTNVTQSYYFYVKRDLPDSDKLIEAVINVNYNRFI